MSATTDKVGFLERLRQGPVVGDGSYTVVLEKRGYVLAGKWTPEAVLQYPDAVRQLHRDYLRAGADVIQAYTFHATEDKLRTANGDIYDVTALNDKACALAREVADTGGAYVCGGLSPTNMYSHEESCSKEDVQAEFKKQVDVFRKHKIDFVLGEFFGHIIETEWAIEVMKTLGLPVGITMRIGPMGDYSGVSAGDCAVRMAKAGADILGVNCCYDIKTTLKTIKMMKDALDAEGLTPFLITQPVAFHCQEAENFRDGYMALPEFPFALEPRLFTRWDVRKYAREACDLGVRYIGGCCGFESYHIREIAEELAEKTGKRPPGADKNAPYGAMMKDDNYMPCLMRRTTKEYWENLKPSFGRPDCPLTSTPETD